LRDVGVALGGGAEGPEPGNKNKPGCGGPKLITGGGATGRLDPKDSGGLIGLFEFKFTSENGSDDVVFVTESLNKVTDFGGSIAPSVFRVT
jgi:hypothetical protein